MENCINDIHKWMAHNKLKLNEEKTDILICVPSCQTHKYSINSISGGNVEALDSVGNSGVIIKDRETQQVGWGLYY